MRAALRRLACLLPLALLLGCAAVRIPVPLGEGVTCGGLTYRVLGCSWAHHLHTDAGRAVPTHNYLLVRLEVANAGGASLPAMWLPGLWLVDEHKETFQPSPVTAGLPGGLKGSGAAWRPTEKRTGIVVFDVPQALYWLRPEGCPPLDLACWWPERFGD